MVLGCLCSTPLPSWLWNKTKRILPLRLVIFAAVSVVCVAFVVGATGSAALYADF